MAEGRRVGDDTVSWQVTKLAKAHRALVGDALAKLGLHLGQDLLLEQLWRQDGLTQSALVARLGVEPPTVTKMLQRLERAGLLRRSRDPENARLWRVFLTEQGRELQQPVRELGALVTGVTPRHPGVLVKTVTTLDVVSGGRAWLGIGAAWNEQESRGLGIPFPPTAERFERLEETLRIAHQMWAGDRRPFIARHYRLEDPLNVPNALRRPHPPILVGGSGERKTLRLVARYGDACNRFELGGLAALRHKLEVLAGHCADVGRPYEEIQKTTFGRVGETESPGELVERFGRLAAEGVDLAIVELPDQGRGGSLERLAEAAATVSDLAPAGR